jgi:hypothetical protein
MILDKEKCAAIFNEWMRKYKEKPEDFSDDDSDNYGESCADTFFGIAEAMENKP